MVASAVRANYAKYLPASPPFQRIASFLLSLLTGSIISDRRRKFFNRVVGQVNIPRLFINANADSLHRFAHFPNVVANDSEVFRFPLDVDGYTGFATAIDDAISFHRVAVRPECLAAANYTEKYADLTTIGNDVVPHQIVGIGVSDRDAGGICIEPVVFG